MIYFSPRFLFLPLCLVSLAVSGVTARNVGADEASGERLVPAALGIRTDRKGTSWNVEPNGTIGRIGSTMVNSGLALHVDGEPFTGFQPMMTPDGREFVIPGRPFSAYPGLQVQRRIRLLENEGLLRYAEMLYNGSTDPVTVTLSLHTNFSGNYQTFLTNRGRTEPVLLEEGESGLVVLPGVAQATRAFLFLLADGESAIKPSISAQNRYGLGFQYPLTLAPGETQIVVHQVAQVIIPQNFDRPTLVKLFQPYSFRETAALLPDDWRPHLVNLGGNRAAVPAPGVEFSGIGSLGIESGPRDILALGEKTRLIGEAAGGQVDFKTPYGRAVLPFANIAAVQGKRGKSGDQVRLFLRDGQVFSAEVEIPELQFRQTGGDTIPLSLDSLDRLVMAQRDALSPGAEAAPVGAGHAPAVLLETYRGDRIKVVASESAVMEGVTPWGRLPIRLSEMLRLRPAATKWDGHWAELKDGTRCLVYLRDSELAITALTLGEITLESNLLRSVYTDLSEEPGRWDSDLGIRTVVQLAGAQRLVGEIGNTTIPLVSEGLRFDIASSKIRRIEKISETALSGGGIPEAIPSFQVERWDGGVVLGFIDLDLLSFRYREQDWKIPLRDITRIENPSPELTPDALEEISTLIDQLGEPEWSLREKATRELGAFGYLASPVLRRHLRDSKDPEVSRRIERILAGLN